VAVNVEIRTGQIGGNSLVTDYLNARVELRPFFPGHPFDPGTYRRKAEEVRARFDDTKRRAMADAVRPVGEEAARKLQQIAGGDGFFVTTGQQPGLFGGPLYTIHKALSAIALARRLETLLETPVMPLFWVASDDHDWEEANHTYILDAGNDLHRLELAGDPDSARSMGRRALDGGAESALNGLAETLPPSEFRSDILERLEAAYGAGTVADAFTVTLMGLLEDLGLGVTDAQDPVIRRLDEPVIRRELENAEAHERALREQTERLEAAGYAVQVPILPGAANVFYEDDEHGRERLLREDGSWLLRASRRTLSEAELWELYEEAPERFSANVVLRPVVESAVFPTLAYVGGPGEASYLAQTGCLFEAHGVGMPVVFPRFSVTLVEGKVEKVLEKFGLTESDFVSRPVHEVVSEVVRDDVPDDVQAAVGRLRQAVQEGYQAVYDAAESIDPTLKGPIFSARNEGFKAISDVEKKIRHHVKLNEETELEQIEKAAVNLAPEGKPQERVLNVHHYLARYGAGLIPAILDRLDVRLDREEAGWTGVECG
jgi:bacillithiol biosynthesis cysteine-adding enzyme BshC